MRKFISFVLMILCANMALRAQVRSEDTVEAERLWEQIVEAKGGRTKLHGVTNLLLTKGSKPPNVEIDLYVYPNRYWTWSKGKIVYDYNESSMANLDRGIFLFDPQPINADKVQPVEGGSNYKETWLLDACIFFLENKWLKPMPIRVRRETVGKQKMDVIETRFPHSATLSDVTLSYYVEPEDLEVRGIAYYSSKYNQILRFYAFDDYSEVDGIRVPKGFTVIPKVEFPKKSRMLPLTFQFNVDYDKELFNRPPSVAAGPDAWKPKP